MVTLSTPAVILKEVRPSQVAEVEKQRRHIIGSSPTPATNVRECWQFTAWGSPIRFNEKMVLGIVNTKAGGGLPILIPAQLR